jgi:uncharacterized protein (DUF2141 family)
MRFNLFFLVVYLIVSSSSIENGVKLEVNVNGIATKEGNVHVALFREQDSFPTHGNQFKGQVIPVKNTMVSAAFMNLKPGTYAIAVFHDRNKNGKLDKNIFGAPTESYGFSNNVRSTFSAPTFSAASFELKNDDLQLKVTVR